MACFSMELGNLSSLHVFILARFFLGTCHTFLGQNRYKVGISVPQFCFK